MKKFFITVRAEIVKQHRNWFHSRFTYFTLMIWPILLFFNAYFTYKSFDLGVAFKSYNMDSEKALMLFLVTGFIGYNCFWSMVQSAWQMKFERENGTLETIFISPANRMAIVYGRALGALFENIWMFTLFGVFVLMMKGSISSSKIIYLPLVVLVILVSATIWGGLMNVIFMFSRDASALFNIFDEPMVLFSGVRVPIQSFPYWAKVISVVFPLTHSLVVVRSIFMPIDSNSLLSATIKLLISLSIIVFFTRILINMAEKNARKSGELNLY